MLLIGYLALDVMCILLDPLIKKNFHELDSWAILGHSFKKEERRKGGRKKGKAENNRAEMGLKAHPLTH